MRPALDSTRAPRAPWERAAFTATAVVLGAGAAFGAVVSAGLIVLAVALRISESEPCDPDQLCENMALALEGPAFLTGLLGAAAVWLLAVFARGAWRARGPRVITVAGPDSYPQGRRG